MYLRLAPVSGTMIAAQQSAARRNPAHGADEEGGVEHELIFRWILGLLFLVTWLPRKVYERLSRRRAAEGLVQDRDRRPLIAAQSLLLAVSLVAMLFTLFKPEWVRWAAFAVLRWLRWIGAVVGTVGAALLLWTYAVLGRNFFGGVKIRSGHELVQSGPYRWVRHPTYSAFLLLGVGFLLLSADWLVDGAWLAGTALVLASRLRPEESMLEEQFGAAYTAYRDRTGRLWPRLLRR